MNTTKPKRQGNLSRLFQELYDSKYKRQHTRYAEEFLRNWKLHLEKEFGARIVSRVKPTHVYEWHRRYGSSPYAGNRSKSVLSQVFKFAELRGLIPVGANPCRVVPDHKEKKRTRYATCGELARIGRSLSHFYSAYPREVTFLYLLLYTGSRPSAIERFTWNNLVRVGRGGYFKVQGKTGEEVIALPHEACLLLDRLKSTGEGSLVVGPFPRRLWEKIRSEVGCPDLWARDFRRTFATLGLSHGLSLGLVGELLNHKKLQTTMRYSKLILDARIEGTQKIGQMIGRVIHANGEEASTDSGRLTTNSGFRSGA